MVTHPEYDDRFSRPIEEIRVEGDRTGSAVTRLDGALWRIRAPGGIAVIHYRIRLPVLLQARRFARYPFLSLHGGVIGGVQTFLCIVGQEAHPVPFDTTALITGVTRLAREARTVFGRFPYRGYTFLLEGGALGALEHLNSLTAGFSSVDFSRDPRPFFAGIAHEYFHTWNLLRLRPAESGGISCGAAPKSRGLWWSEGVTMMYADILRRRAGLPVEGATRRAHIRELIGRYHSNSGNARFSPEEVSLHAVDSTPGGLGDSVQVPTCRESSWGQ